MAIEIPRRMKITIFPGTDKEETVEVQIIDVTTLLTFPTPMTPEETLSITYVRGIFPPSVVWVPKKEATLERIQEEIRKDIERLAAPPETFIIP